MTTAILPLANLTLWVSPLWLLSFSATIAAAILVALWAVLWLVNRGAARQVITLVQEGILAPISYVVLAMITLFVVASPVAPTGEIFDSLRRLGSVGESRLSETIGPRTDDQPITVSFKADELVDYEIRSDQDVRIASEPGGSITSPLAIVAGDEPYLWNRNAKLARGFQGDVTEFYVTNEGDAAANVEMIFRTDVRVSEVHHLPIVVGAVVGFYLIYLLIFLLAPGVANIATATAKEAIGQPLFLLFLLLGSAALVIYVVLPYNTFGEDVKMLLQSGLETIMGLAIIFALWTASVSVASEIEGKTALTLLSKPISRREFILGKFAGIVWSVSVLFVVLGALLMATVSYKVVYDARETSNPTPSWQECYAAVMQIPPGLTLAFLETTALAAVSVAISTRLPMLPNLLICGSVYVIGHLTPLMAQSTVAGNEFVQFFAKLFAVLLPELDHFNIQAAVAAGQPVPHAYLAWAALYCVVYCAFAMFFALILFEDRDLA